MSHGRRWSLAVILITLTWVETSFAQGLFFERGPGPESLSWSEDGQTPYVQVLGGSHRFGDGLGYTNNYTDVDWLVPLKVDDPQDIVFADLHFLIKNDGNLGGNVDLAYRYYNTDWNRIFGVYGSYDYTQTDNNGFRQLGFGIESLGLIVDFRGNLYLPNIYEVRGPLANQFVGHNLIINRAEVAMTGGDLELGVNLPVIQNMRSRVFVGGYFYDGHGTGNTSGWKLRGEAELNRTAWVDVAIQDDNLFGRTVSFGLSMRYAHRFLPPFRQAEQTMDHKFFRERTANSDVNISDRLTDPINRTRFIVLTSDAGTIATDTGGTPLNFLHVQNGFAGTGTIENPYGTLTAALADAAAPTSIIYTPHGGTFVENVNLVAGATVLSNGPAQTVTTQIGDQQLPFSGSVSGLTGLPSIVGNVTLADDSTFSGFDVTGGMTATAVNNFLVETSQVNNPAGDAIVVADVDTGEFRNLQVSSAAGRGLLINNSAPILSDITVTSATDDGIEINTIATDRVLALNNFNISGVAGQGIDANVTGAGMLDLSLTGTTTVESTGTALDANLNAGSTGDMLLAIDDLTAASTAGQGVNLDGSAAGTGDLTVTRLTQLTVTSAMTDGIFADTVTFDANPTQMGIQALAANQITVGNSASTTDVSGNGIRLLDPTGNLAVTTLNIANDSGTGLLIDTKGGGTTFTLATSTGDIVTTNGPAMNLDPLTVGLVLNSIRSDNSPTNGVILDTVTGAIDIAQSTLFMSTAPAILIQNTPAPLNANFGNTEIHSTISGLQADNVDTTMGNGMNLTVGFDNLNIIFP
ncbi:MAG: hypothetical protein KDA88_13540 [Planctomycetaceae bacterium]|nr:hypothetical protein [Planctomycetaceae bacterium]MCB9949840.1 hypothetical protein [Planctomycetaceae bacterium]